MRTPALLAIAAVALAGCAKSVPSSSDPGEIHFSDSDEVAESTAPSRTEPSADASPVDAAAPAPERAPGAASDGAPPSASPSSASREAAGGEAKKSADSEAIVGWDAAAEPESEPWVAKPDPGIRPGTLTAGVFDDTRNPEVFQRFVDGMRGVTRIADPLAQPLTVITVVDAAGAPVSNARVYAGRELLTRTDGRVVLTGADIPPHRGRRLPVTVKVGSRSVSARVRIGDEDARIRLPFRLVQDPVRALDVALVIDTTGSMQDELDYLKVEVRSIAEAVTHAFPEVEQRWALVVYRDHGDAYVTRAFDFTGDVTQFVGELGKQSAEGGGDYPEAMDAALHDAAELAWTPGDAARVTFVLADAPPHPEHDLSAMRAADDLRSRGVAIYPIAASGVASEAEIVMRAAAVMSGGQYIFLTDDSGVGLPHAEPHIPCYAVEDLRDAMARMLRTELAGIRVEAAPGRVVRWVGEGRNGVCRNSRSSQRPFSPWN